MSIYTWIVFDVSASGTPDWEEKISSFVSLATNAAIPLAQHYSYFLLPSFDLAATKL
ncbi:hypothetical protein WAI453_008014 [Rhynchosporium graminicola]